MEVLVYLAQRQGEVVTREELEQHVWRGALVGYDAVTNTVIKLRKALGDDAREPGIVATIPKRGYRLVAPVRYLDEQPDPPPAAAPPINPVSLPAARAGSGSARKILLGVALVGLVGLAAELLWIWPPTALQSVVPSAGGTSAHSLVVLPFESLGDDQKQEHFADGITEDLITDLSNVSHLSVVGSNTAFSYKGKQVKPQEVARELGVDYVVEGSVRQDAGSARVNARLVDAKTGFERWGERFDRHLAEVFSAQDEVTDRIVAALATTLTQPDKEDVAQPTTDNLVAYDHFQEGQKLAQMQTRETALAAEEAFRSAIEADPTYARAYCALAYILARNFRYGWTEAPVETIDRALELANKAVSLDGSIPQPYWALGYVYLMRKEYDKAEAALRDALKVAPAYADSYGLLALFKNVMGEPETAIELIKRGMELNPHYTWDYPYNLGRAYYTLGRINEAIAALEEAKTRNENATVVRLQLAASYARAGRQADAEWEIQELEIMNPKDTLSNLKKTDPLNNAKLMDEFLADLRKAGLPE
jgi:TolB-like protein